MDGGCKTSWEHLTRSITTALSGTGSIWDAIRKETGSPGEIRDETGAKSPVWLVPFARITPPPRRSVLGYAEVSEIDPRHAAWRRVAPPRPAPGSAGPEDDLRQGAWTTEAGSCELRSLLQSVPRDAASLEGRNIVRDAFASMRNEALADVEREVRKSLAGVKGDGLAYELHLQNTRQGSDEKASLRARHVLNAGRRLTEGRSQVPFPHGLFCMLSPSQAAQLMLEGTLDAGSMSVCGIDIVVSPVVGHRTDLEARSAMVASRGSVDVALSKAEVRIVKDAKACRIEMEYAVGAEIAPHMTARIVTEQGGGALESDG